MKGRNRGKGEVILVQHAEHEEAGLMGPAFVDCGLTIRTVRTYAGDPVPRAAGGAGARRRGLALSRMTTAAARPGS